MNNTLTLCQDHDKLPQESKHENIISGWTSAGQVGPQGACVSMCEYVSMCELEHRYPFSLLLQILCRD